MNETLTAFINEMYLRHSNWIVVARKYGAGDQAEDVVQDSYIKLITWAQGEDKVLADSVFFFIVRNTAIDITRKKCNDVELTDKIQQAEQHEAGYTDNQITAIHQAIKEFHWFDAKLLDLYFNLSQINKSDFSMRGLSEETGLSVSTIYETIKRCKEKIKAKVEKVKD